MPLPVSVYIINPTRNLSAGNPEITELSAAISLENGVFQFAVLSRTISTLGAASTLGGVPTKRSMSSAWPGICATINVAISNRKSIFMAISRIAPD
ncbi:hypothetical protein D3C85_1369990 [compost metagenome]